MPSSSPDPHTITRQVTSTDLPLVRHLHTSLLPVKYPSSFFTQLLLNPSRISFASYTKSNPTAPIAFISACLRQAPTVSWVSAESPDHHSFDSAETHIEILTLGVLPAYRKRGLAKLLIRRVHEHFRAQAHNFENGTMIHANVATSNISALQFYKQMGMRIASDVIRNLYRSSETGSKDGYLVRGFVYF